MGFGRLVLALGALALVSTNAGAQEDEADAEAGLLLFNNACRTCHVTAEGDHRLGPSLHGIVGREAGTQEGFGYSSAMQQSDIVWDEESLDRFIADPDAVIPGNNMKPFSGISSADERAAIIGHLKAQSEN